MKISQMLKREDFYDIIQKTLDQYYCDEKAKNVRLYIYPELNAITNFSPSKDVKKYIYNEYKIEGSLLKRLLVYLYTRTFINSFGLLSSKKCRISFDFTSDNLIYPCNKKIRIFDFHNRTVRVIPKEGFPTNDLKNEIEFRTHHKSDFILPFLYHKDEEYTEKIIDGKPLARIKNNDALKNKAWAIWREYINASIRRVSTKDYAEVLRNQWNASISKIKAKGIHELKEIENKLYDTIYSEESEIEIGLSHGDLQPGNIWVEDSTQRIYIIDWESFGTRSIWYDQCLLFDNLRKESGLNLFLKKTDFMHCVVLYEDMLYRLNEMNTLSSIETNQDLTSLINSLTSSENV